MQAISPYSVDYISCNPICLSKMWLVICIQHQWITLLCIEVIMLKDNILYLLSNCQHHAHKSTYNCPLHHSVLWIVLLVRRHTRSSLMNIVPKTEVYQTPSNTIHLLSIWLFAEVFTRFCVNADGGASQPRRWNIYKHINLTWGVYGVDWCLYYHFVTPIPTTLLYSVPSALMPTSVSNVAPNSLQAIALYFPTKR